MFMLSVTSSGASCDWYEEKDSVKRCEESSNCYDENFDKCDGFDDCGAKDDNGGIDEDCSDSKGSNGI